MDDQNIELENDEKEVEKTQKWIDSLETDNGKWVYKLQDPITLGKKKVEKFSLERPKAKHWREVSTKMKMGDFMNVISNVAHEPKSTIDELSMKDLNKLIEFVGHFG